MKLTLYFLGMIAFIAVIGLIGMVWTELDKNNKCVQIVNNPNFNAQKHEEVIRKFCQ